MTETDWATVEITVRHATPVTPCRSGCHGFHTSDCDDVDSLNEVLGGLCAAVSTPRSRAVPDTFAGPGRRPEGQQAPCAEEVTALWPLDRKQPPAT